MSEEARSLSHIIPVQREAISTLRNGKFDRALSAQQDSIQTFSNSIAQKYRGQCLRGESFMCMPAIISIQDTDAGQLHRPLRFHILYTADLHPTHGDDNLYRA